MPGFHLPVLAGAASGLFARYNLDVEIVDPPPGPGTESSKLVAAGEADFCLTGTTYFCLASAECGWELQARFVAVLHQSSPLSGIVAGASDLHVPADLAGRRLGGDPDAWLTREYLAALSRSGVAPPAVVAMAQGDASEALGRGEIDVMCTFADALPSAEKRAGIALRFIGLGGDTYASGLVAGDHVGAEVAARMRLCLGDALLLQRDDPELGAEEFCRRYPGTTRGHALASWDLFAPYALGGGKPAGMEPVRWGATIAEAAAVHGLAAPLPHAVYRPELATDLAVIEEVGR